MYENWFYWIFPLSLSLSLSLSAQVDKPWSARHQFSPDQLVVKFAPGQEALARQLVPELTAQQLEQVGNGHSLTLKVAAPRDVMALAKEWYDLEQVQYASPVILNALGEPAGAYTDRLILRTRQRSSLKELIATLADFGLTQVEPYPYEAQTFIIRIPKKLGKLAPELCENLAVLQMLDWVEPNYLLFTRGASLPNDPLFGQQWALRNTGQNGGTPGADSKVHEAWTFATGQGIKIAVLDDGVEATHPDLQANILTTSNVTTATSGGMIHGTQVCGVAAAVGNNSLGITGVAYNARLIPIRTVIANAVINNAELLWMATAIDQARVVHNADVINISQETYFGSDSAFNVYKQAVSNAATLGRNGRGCVISVAMGNRGSDNPNAFTQINGFVVPGTIGVGATDSIDRRYFFSSYVNTNIFSNPGNFLSVMAPGAVTTTDLVGLAGNAAGDYTNANWRGTSFSAPIVSGAAALLLSANGNLTAQQVKNYLELTADKVGPDPYNFNYPNGAYSNEMGYGRINAGRLLRWGVQPNPTTLQINPSVPTVCPNQSVQLTALHEGVALASSPNPSTLFGIQEVQWSVSPGQGSITMVNNTSIPGARINFTPSNTISFSVSLQMRVRNLAGWSSWRNIILNRSSSCGSGWRFAYGPNPGQDKLTISALPETGRTTVGEPSEKDIAPPAFSAVLFNALGEPVREGTAKNGELVLDLGGLPRGTYFLHLFDAEGKLLEKRQIQVGPPLSN